MEKRCSLKLSLILIFSLFLVVGMGSSVLAEITSITIDSPDGGEYWSGTQDIEWTTTGGDGDKIDILWSTGGGWTYIQVFKAHDGSPYAWDTTSVSDNTNYQILIKDSNNPSMNDVSAAVFTIDNTPPIATISGVSGSWATSDIIDISCSDTGGSGCVSVKQYYFDADGACSTDKADYTSSTNEDSIIVDTSNNDYLCLWVEDNAGNSDTDVSTQLMVDSDNPTITSISPEDGTYTNDNTPTISANIVDTLSGIDSYTMTVDGTLVTPTLEGEVLSYTPTTPLDEKLISVVITATDDAGNQETSSTTFTVDTTDPVVDITNPVDNSVTDSSVDLTYGITETNNPPTCYYKIDEGTYMEDSDCGTATTIDGLSEGRRIITVKVEDGAGNIAIDEVSFVVDTNNKLTVCASGCDFDVIQDAIDKATSGDTIDVGAGTYEPFIVDGRNNLNIVGNGNVIVDGTQQVTTNYGERHVAVFIEDSSNILLDGLTIQNTGYDGSVGDGKDYSIVYEESSGEIKDCVISPNSIGDMSSVGIGVWDDSDVTIDPTLIENFGRIGVFIYDGCAVEILDSTIIGQVYSGEGEVNYGIEIEGAWGSADPSTASHVTIVNNEIYNCDNTFSPEPSWESGGIYINGWLEYMDEADSTVIIEDNKIHNNYIGIIAIKSSNSYAHSNKIYDNRVYGIESSEAYDATTAIFNATYNYWGDTDPSDDVSENVGYDPWYLDEAMNLLSNEPVTDAYVDDNYDAALCEEDGYFWNYNCFDTIQNAIDAVNENGVVDVGAGTYEEEIVINKRITLNGAQAGIDARTRTGDETIIRPTTTPANHGAVIYISADNVIIDGIELDGTTVANNGIYGWETSGLTIQNNKIHGAINAWDGCGVLLISWGNSGTVYDNTIQNNVIYDTGRMGIMVMDHSSSDYTITYNNEISNNKVYDTWKKATEWEDHGGAIQFNVGKDMSITGNEIFNTQDGQRGIYVYGSAFGNIIYGNDIHDNPIGIQIWPDGINPDGTLGTSIDWGGETATSPTISNNKIYDNLEYGAKIYSGPSFGSLNAENNWWGHVTGPYHSTNSDGQGNDVSDNVDFTPWSINEQHNTDLIAPTTLINSPGPSSWQNQDFGVSLADSDTGDPVASGLKRCRYRIKSDGGVTKNLGDRDCSAIVILTVGEDPKYCRGEGIDMCKIQAFAIDNANNGGESVNMVERTFSIDWTNPTGSILIENGADYVSDVNVGLNLVYSDNLDSNLECRYSNDGVSWTEWETCTSTKTWALTSGDGSKDVYYEIKDDAENVNQYSDSIILDTQAPTITNVDPGDTTIQIGETVTITATVTDANNVVSVKLYTDEDQPIGDLVENPEDVWSLISDPFNEKGDYKYYLLAEDEIGNQRIDPEVGYYTITVNSLSWNLDNEWNLVSVPKTLTTNLKASLLPDNTVWKYDAVAETWNSITTIDPGVGYWVDNNPLTNLGLDYTDDCSGPECGPSETIYLQPSWNLIGHMCTIGQDVEVAFPSDIYNNLFVLRYDEEDDEFEIYATQDPLNAEFDEMITGEGYWVFVVGSDQLPYTNVC